MFKKGKNFEEDYFLKEDIQAKHRLEVEKKRKISKKKENELRKLHYMKCPKCGQDLVTKRMSFIDVDQCPNCGSLVLAQKDIEKFITEEKSILKSLVDFFK